MEAYWKHRDTSQFCEAIEAVETMPSYLITKDAKAAKNTFRNVTAAEAIQELLKEINKFTEKCKQESEICYIKKLIRSDREANFLLHVDTVGELCAIFTGADGVNYQRCCSFYHEILKNLKNSHPGIYTEFMQGNFVVKTCEGIFLIL